MAAFFIGLIRVIVKTQGGANKAKEDAAVDAALARAEGAHRATAPYTDAWAVAHCPFYPICHIGRLSARPCGNFPLLF
jgi:hypothetical protein